MLGRQLLQAAWVLGLCAEGRQCQRDGGLPGVRQPGRGEKDCVQRGCWHLTPRNARVSLNSSLQTPRAQLFPSRSAILPASSCSGKQNAFAWAGLSGEQLWVTACLSLPASSSAPKRRICYGTARTPPPGSPAISSTRRATARSWGWLLFLRNVIKSTMLASTRFSIATCMQAVCEAEPYLQTNCKSLFGLFTIGCTPAQCQCKGRPATSLQLILSFTKNQSCSQKDQQTVCTRIKTTVSAKRICNQFAHEWPNADIVCERGQEWEWSNHGRSAISLSPMWFLPPYMQSTVHHDLSAPGMDNGHEYHVKKENLEVQYMKHFFNSSWISFKYSRILHRLQSHVWRSTNKRLWEYTEVLFCENFQKELLLWVMRYTEVEFSRKYLILRT